MRNVILEWSISKLKREYNFEHVLNDNLRSDDDDLVVNCPRPQPCARRSNK